MNLITISITLYLHNDDLYLTRAVMGLCIFHALLRLLTTSSISAPIDRIDSIIETPKNFESSLKVIF